MKLFNSIYSELIEEFLQFKRNLGYKMSNPSSFSLFDAYISEHQIAKIGLTCEECDLWSKKRPNEKNTTCYKRVNDIRNFCIFLNQNGYDSCIPKHTVKPTKDYMPYIFTREEIYQFFLICDSLKITNYSNTTYIYPTLFRLLFGTGIRIGEALNLKMSDINFDNNTLILHETKNGEERIIPFTESLATILQEYVFRFRCYCNRTDYIFIQKYGTKVTGDTVYKWFRKILKKAKISHGGRGKGPTVHSWRHTFSVYSLAKMDEKNLDLYYALPVLSKYLGHKSLEATEKYVRLTEQMYPGIMEKMNQLCTYVFPEVTTYETY